MQSLKNKLGEEKYNSLITRLKEFNKFIEKRGISLFQNNRYLYTGYSYNEYFDWDMYFENIFLSYYGISKFCRNNAEAFLDNQLLNGHISKTLSTQNFTQHFKPFMAQVALLGSRQTGSYEWLRSNYYSRIKKYLDCWFWFWDYDKNGLCVWDSCDHTGMDNHEPRCGWLKTCEVEGVDLNCYLYRELQSMALIAENLGFAEDKKSYEQHAKKLASLINEVFWDEKDGFYYDRNERTGELVRLKTIAGFSPMYYGIASPEQVKRLVEEHLTNPEEFWTKYPVATWAKNDPLYYQDRKGIEANWRGPTWAPTNYLIMHGLKDYGYDELASELAIKSMEMALAEPETREYYNAETGVGLGLNPFWGWSVLLYFMPLELELGYNPTDIYTEKIKPIAIDELGLNLDLI